MFASWHFSPPHNNNAIPPKTNIGRDGIQAASLASQTTKNHTAPIRAHSETS
jgi:hypothetical protein